MACTRARAHTVMGDCSSTSSAFVLHIWRCRHIFPLLNGTIERLQSLRCLNSSAQFKFTIRTPISRTVPESPSCSEPAFVGSFVEAANLSQNTTVCVCLCSAWGGHFLPSGSHTLLEQSLHFGPTQRLFRLCTSCLVLIQWHPVTLISTLLCSSKEAEAFFNLFLSGQSIQMSNIQFLPWRMTNTVRGLSSPLLTSPPPRSPWWQSAPLEWLLCAPNPELAVPLFCALAKSM